MSLKAEMKTRKKNISAQLIAPRYEPVNTRTKAYLLQSAEELKRSAQHTLEEFQGRITKYGYAYAFEWSASAFQAAARVAVAESLIAWLDKQVEGKTEAEMVEMILKEVGRIVVRGARWPEHSTSQQSNVMKTEITAVWADFYAKYTEE